MKIIEGMVRQNYLINEGDEFYMKYKMTPKLKIAEIIYKSNLKTQEKIEQLNEIKFLDENELEIWLQIDGTLNGIITKTIKSKYGK